MTSLQNLTSDLEIVDYVNFMGQCSNEEVAYSMSRSDCFVIPSEYDTWGLAANEVLVARLPIIVTGTCGCAEELVRSGIEGIVVPPKQSKPLALAMIKIAKSPELREEFINNGQLRIKKFSLSIWSNNALFIGGEVIGRGYAKK